jgi:hypothetical protein
MDPSKVLLARLETLEAELDRALFKVRGSKRNPPLGKAARGKFETLITATLKPRVVQLRMSAPSKAPQDAWRELDLIQKRCEKVVRECFAFLLGLAARTEGLDGAPDTDAGLCHLADALVFELRDSAQGEWWGLTIPGEEEFVAEMAHIIRVRWADVSIWNLPVVAHEFGHLVAQNFKAPDSDRRPLKEILDRHGAPDHPKLNEYFADLFAVYSLGFCYGCCCLLLRFNPRTAFDEPKDHPSEAKRAHFILKVLDDQASKDPVQAAPALTVELLRKGWLGLLDEAGYDPAADAKAKVEAEARFVEFRPLLQQFQVGLAYRGWLRAQGLYIRLRDDDTPKPAPGDTRRDVLNGAWLSRIDPHLALRLRDIGTRAIKVYRGIA